MIYKLHVSSLTVTVSDLYVFQQCQKSKVVGATSQCNKRLESLALKVLLNWGPPKDLNLAAKMPQVDTSSMAIQPQTSSVLVTLVQCNSVAKPQAAALRQFGATLHRPCTQAGLCKSNSVSRGDCGNHIFARGRSASQEGGLSCHGNPLPH